MCKPFTLRNFPLYCAPLSNITPKSLSNLMGACKLRLICMSINVYCWKQPPLPVFVALELDFRYLWDEEYGMKWGNKVTMTSSLTFYIFSLLMENFLFKNNWKASKVLLKLVRLLFLQDELSKFIRINAYVRIHSYCYWA